MRRSNLPTVTSDTLNSSVDPEAPRALRPRRFWQGVVILYALLFLVSGLLLAMAGVRPDASALLIGGIDLLALLALAGYAWRRPLPHAGPQLLVFLLATLQLGRAALIAIAVWPNLVPWHGDEIAWQALGLYAGLPLLVLVALGLHRYATDRGHAQ